VNDKATQPTLGKLIDQLDALRDKYRAASEKATEIKAAYKEKEDKVIEALQKEKVEKASGKRSTVSLKYSIVPTIENYTTFIDYVARTKSFHLFNRAVNAVAFRELLESGSPDDDIDKFVARTGLAPFEKVSLNHRAFQERKAP
jgi:hypothetical protein